MDSNLITLERLKQVLHLDEETYVFYWKVDLKFKRDNGRLVKDAGTLVSGRIQIAIDKKKYKAHRLVWLWVYGKWPEKHLDHIDGNPLNNNPNNLREATPAQNAWNNKKSSSNTSGYKGVSYCKSRGNYEVKIKSNGKILNLGRFKLPEEAHAAYIEAAKKYHGEFARFE